MKIYLADTDTGGRKPALKMAQVGLHEFNPSSRLACLLSFYYFKKVDLDSFFSYNALAPQLLADSGAFSAFTLGKPIVLQEYADWLFRWKHLLHAYSNLDVIGDAEATLSNQHKMEALGLKPLPVFHVNEPWHYLERYLAEYDYIALGGLVPHAFHSAALMPWLVKAFGMLAPGQGYHGFGVSGWTVLKSLPWKSVDSTSWSIGYRYGRVPLFSPVEGKLVSAYLGDAVSCFKYRALFEYCGYDWKDFADRGRNDRAKIAGVSAISYMRLEDWLCRRHGKETQIYLSLIEGDYERLFEGIYG